VSALAAVATTIDSKFAAAAAVSHSVQRMLFEHITSAVIAPFPDAYCRWELAWRVEF
jgi:hypothetical protein